MIDKLIYKYSLHVHLIGDPCSVQNYGSLDSGELAKFMREKDRSVFDATIMSEIDQTMKKDRKSTRLNSSHSEISRMPSSA